MSTLFTLKIIGTKLLIGQNKVLPRKENKYCDYDTSAITFQEINRLRCACSLYLKIRAMIDLKTSTFFFWRQYSIGVKLL